MRLDNKKKVENISVYGYFSVPRKSDIFHKFPIVSISVILSFFMSFHYHYKGTKPFQKGVSEGNGRLKCWKFSSNFSVILV